MGKQSRLLAERKMQNIARKVPYVVALEVMMKLTREEREVLLDFQQELNTPEQPALSVEEISKKLIFWGMNQIRELGRQRQAMLEQLEKEKANGGKVSGNTQTDTAPASNSKDVDSPTLANTQNTTPASE